MRQCMFKAKTKHLMTVAEKSAQHIARLESLLNENTSVYIDFGNVSQWGRKLGWDIDLLKLKHLLESFGISKPNFYFGTLQGHDGSSRFMSFVHKNGYRVRTKPVKIMNLSIDVSSISQKSPD